MPASTDDGKLGDPALLILTSLAEGAKHGYAMVDDIERFSGSRLGPGTLYGALVRLEERGLIKPVESADRRRPYRLTMRGSQALAREAEALDRVVRLVEVRLGGSGRGAGQVRPNERRSRRDATRRTGRPRSRLAAVAPPDRPLPGSLATPVRRRAQIGRA